MNDSVLASRLDQLDTARESWKARVPQTDAVKFTVEGKMGLASPLVSTPVESERKKRSPKQVWVFFRLQKKILIFFSS